MAVYNGKTQEVFYNAIFF